MQGELLSLGLQVVASNQLNMLFKVNICSFCSALKMEFTLAVQILVNDPLRKTGQMFYLLVPTLILWNLCISKQHYGNHKRGL